MDELNRIIQDYLNDVSEYDFDDYSAVKKMSEIILSNRYPDFRDKIKSRFGLSKSVDLAFSFFDRIGYGDYFLERINDGTFSFKHVSKRSDETPVSFYNYELCKNEIYLPYSNDINDAYYIVHEFLHDTNLDINNLSYTRGIFTEYISMFGEFLFEYFIKENYNINSFRNDINYSFNSCYVSALKVDFQLNLLKCYLDKGYLNNYFLNSIINKYDSKHEATLWRNCYSIIDKKDLNFGFHMRYLFGILLSCYSYDLFLNNKFDLDLFTLINDNINYMEPEDVYGLLDLDVIDDFNLLLSPDSYEKIDKSYRKIMGKR